MQQECIDLIKKLTKKKHVLLTDRANISIKLCLNLMHDKGVSNVILQDQGGWITYNQFAKKYNLAVTELTTSYGLVDDFVLLKNISAKINSKHSNSTDNPTTALLLNSMPAYAYLQDMERISEFCMSNNLILINDASGSIGQEEGTKGDLIFASFGKNKPVDLGHGSFIATDNKDFYDFLIDVNRFKLTLDYDILHDKLTKLRQRINKFNELDNKIKSELNDYDIIHRQKPGFNVIVKYKNDHDLSKIKVYCEKNKYEFVLCPKYIKVLAQAISIEVVRL